ncbi:cytochrome c oxidase subunit 3 [Skermania piniformis]|uniref:Cytochrome aa3 subunit 3 n=1 Tax=Skermania pinensis TaxID=39122 RepID=A0ABX8S5R8_9ACTN|nr:cytochrome c oxidase subunit 3 [Skermania piniformis]QXQ13169.1 cytochrome c oxidase subunit 3 [Skermania piniformis]
MSEISVARRAEPPAPSGRLPGDGHIWVMVLGDLIIFGGYFVVFMLYRSWNPAEFRQAQQHLDLRLGLVNTIVLLTSSWFVVRAVLAVRHGQPARAVQWIRAAAAAGLIFAVLEGSQWYVEIRAGHTNSDLFFAFYYVLTGVHLLHVLIGLIAFGVLVRELRDPRRRRDSVVESGAVYWHMVDLLWVIIFALLYVLR